MYSIQNHPSASSNETNASGSTDQTNVSLDEVIVDETKAAELYTEQSESLAEQRPRTSAIDSFSSDREKHVTFSVAREPHFDTPVQLNTLFKEFSNVRKRYERLKKYFLSLVVLNVVLLLCVGSLMPVTVVSSRIEGNHVAQNTISFDDAFKGFVLRKLASQEASETIRKNVFCGYCGLPKEFQSNFFEEAVEIYDEECCDQDMFTLLQKAKSNFSESVTEFKSALMKMHKNSNRLEDAVVGLEEEVYRDTNDSSRQQSRIKSHTTILHRKVKTNTQLLNKLLNRERSLIQMTGTVCNRFFLNHICDGNNNDGNNKITWVEGLSTGNSMFSRNNSISVASGGTYFIYAKIQFSRQFCNRTEMLEYRVMKQDERTDNSPEPVAHAKQSCTSGGTLEQALTVQKLVFIDKNERASFRIQINTAFQSYLSDDLKIHHFGIFEI